MAYKRFAIKVSVIQKDGRPPWRPLKSKILKVFPYSKIYAESMWTKELFRRKFNEKDAKEWLVEYIMSDKVVVKMPDNGSIIKYDIVEGNYA